MEIPFLNPIKSSSGDQPKSMTGDSIYTNPKTLETEFQKYAINVDVMQIAVYKVFCGWREITDTKESTVLGIKSETKNTSYTIDPNARLMNEAGGNFIFSVVMPLINHVTTTGTLTPLQIFEMWNGHIDTIKYTLLDSYYIPKKNPRYNKAYINKEGETIIENNEYVTDPYQIDVTQIGTIITYVATMSVITAKAKDGFTTTKFADSFTTATILRSDGSIQPQKKGILGSIFG